MVVDIIVFVFDKSVIKGKVVIVSGDVDVILVIKEGLVKNWLFEIWMWEKSILKKLKDFEKENLKLLIIFFLDLYFDNVIFINFRFCIKMKLNLNL